MHTSWLSSSVVTCKFTNAAGKPSHDTSIITFLDVLASTNVSLEGHVAAAGCDNDILVQLSLVPMTLA